MSFGTRLRFDQDVGDKPVVFWQLAKPKKNNRKFSYMRRDQRFPVRHSHLVDHCEQCRYKTVHKHSKQMKPSSNFIQKNISFVQNKSFDRSGHYHEKSFVNNVINRCTPRQRDTDTITLTDTQLNALLDAVRNLSSDTHSTIKFKLDGKEKEIEVNTKGETTHKRQERVKGDNYANHSFGDEVEPPYPQREVERPQGVDRSGVVCSSEHEKGLEDLGGGGAPFDGGSLSPILDEFESTSDNDKSYNQLRADAEGYTESHREPVPIGRKADLPLATVPASIWSDPGSSVELPPLVPRGHLTLAEKKKPQWARERAEFEACYDPWKRGSVGSRAGSILTDYPVMDDEKMVLKKFQERTKWLTELEKQREEQRLQRFEKQQADREAYQNGFIEKFSRDQKPARLPSQVNIQKDRLVFDARYPWSP